MPSSVARLVTQDHDRLVRLLRRVCTPGPSQARWRAELVRLLHAHRVAERDAVLPEVIRLLPGSSDAVRQQAEKDVTLDALAAEIAATDVESPGLRELCERVERAVHEHGESLEAAVLRDLERSVGRKEVRRLGGRYEARRDEQLRANGGHRPPPRRLDLSRAELYEMARRVGIEGRSSMSREQLIDELQRRSPHGSATTTGPE